MALMFTFELRQQLPRLLTLRPRTRGFCGDKSSHLVEYPAKMVCLGARVVVSAGGVRGGRASASRRV